MSTPADTFTDRTDATDEEFRARVAVFDAAEEPEEVVIERVVNAINAVRWPDGEPMVRLARAHMRKVAAAVIAELRGDRPAPEPVAHNHTRFRNDAGPWSPCPVSCPAAGLLR